MDVTYCKLAGSNLASSDGIEMTLTPPNGVKWCSKDEWGKENTWCVHFTHGWHPHDDHKMISLLMRVATGNAEAARFGGLRSTVTKTTISACPTARIVHEDDASKTATDYVFLTDRYYSEKTVEAKAEIEKLKKLCKSATQINTTINNFCSN